MSERIVSVVVGEVEIQQIFYKERPVITFSQVGTLHGVPEGNVRRNFHRHAEEFVQEEDYFRLDTTDAESCGLKVYNSENGVIVFTEAGYILLAKIMRDKMSWHVIRKVRSAYFKLQEIQASGWEAAIEKLANVNVGKFEKIHGYIASVEQKAGADLRDEQSARERGDQGLNTRIGRVQDRVDKLEQKIEHIEPIVAGPYPPPVEPPEVINKTTVRLFILNQIGIIGIKGMPRNKVPMHFCGVFQKYMENHPYPIVEPNPSNPDFPYYDIRDVREAYETGNFQYLSSARGDERLKEECEHFKAWDKQYRGQRSIRMVPRPHTYTPSKPDALPDAP